MLFVLPLVHVLLIHDQQVVVIYEIMSVFVLCVVCVCEFCFCKYYSIHRRFQEVKILLCFVSRVCLAGMNHCVVEGNE